MTYDVIIPALNEERTIGAIVRAFKTHPGIGNVIVVRDDNTTDNTSDVALGQRAVVAYGPQGGGKGQNIKIGLKYVDTERVVLCDGDLQGLTTEHIDMLICDDTPLVVGVPDFPLTEVLCSPKMTWEWMPRVFETYAQVSGERVVATGFLHSIDLHGYLAEVQINMAYEALGVTPEFRQLRGLYSPFKMDDQRMRALLEDRQWGKDNGVFGR